MFKFWKLGAMNFLFKGGGGPGYENITQKTHQSLSVIAKWLKSTFKVVWVIWFIDVLPKIIGHDQSQRLLSLSKVLCIVRVFVYSETRKVSILLFY